MESRPQDGSRGLAGPVLLVGLPGPRLDGAQEAWLRELQPAGVVLFARNLDTPATTRQLLTGVRDCLHAPPWLALDQEGGRVSRLAPWIGRTPAAARLASAGAGAARAFGAATAGLLQALGFNLDFAPVVDVCDPQARNGIGDRSWGTDPQRVAHLAGEFLEGLQQRGVAGCLKHFPGLGPTEVDSHDTLPTVRLDRPRLEATHLEPYRRLATRAASVMVGHGCYPALDPEPGRPATLSAAIVEGLLRGTLGYRGLVVSDDMEMGAVAPLDPDGGAAVGAIEAGCDLLLYCQSRERAERAAAALERRAGDDPAFARRLTAAGRRVRAAAANWPARGDTDDAWPTALHALRGTCTEPGFRGHLPGSR